MVSLSDSKQHPSYEGKSVIFQDIDGVLLDLLWCEYDSFPKSRQKINEIIKAHLGIAGGYYHYTIRDRVAVHHFDEGALKNFHDLISKLDNVVIVLSSMWRDGRSIEELKDLFARHDFAKYIVGKTDHLDDFDHSPVTVQSLVELEAKRKLKRPAPLQNGSLIRAQEINKFIKEHGIKNYVIFDDNNLESALSNEFKERFIKVDPKELLTSADTEKALEVLQKEKPSEERQDEDAQAFIDACKIQ